MHLLQDHVSRFENIMKNADLYKAVEPPKFYIPMTNDLLEAFSMRWSLETNPHML